MNDTRTVIVTGGAGYVGSHAAKALAAAGYQPVTVDNLGRGFRDAVLFGPLEVCDTSDQAGLETIFKKWQPKAVLHFAAFAYVGESVSDPGLYYRNNVGGTLSLMQAMVACGLDKLVFSSTCATYGVPTAVPIPETEKQAPINPYGQSKLMVEKMLADFAPAHKLRSVSLRYFNASGADRDGKIGENHDPETHLIPLAIDAALGYGEKLKVFGDDYPTPDGTCIRDYIHVEDLASAHVAALDYLDQGGETTAFNLGTGSGVSVREIINAVEAETGRPVPHDMAPRRAGDPPALVCDPRRANSELGWKAEVSDIDTIIRTATAWARRRHNQKPQ